MLWRLLADTIVAIHFLFVIFMIIGFLLTLIAAIGVYIFRKGGWFARFFAWSKFRWIHVCGIAFVGSLAVMEKYCPLTTLEIELRRRAEGETYTGSFLVHYIEKLLYPDVNPLAILIPTIFVSAFTVTIFIIRPPWREKSPNPAKNL